jgi:hypothetical protein
MTDVIEFCPECRHHHIPGPCDPNDLTEEGWRLYRAMRVQTFKSTDSDKKLKAGQQ